MDHENFEDFVKRKVIIIDIMIMGCENFHYFWALLKIQTQVNISYNCIQNLKIKTWIKFTNELETTQSTSEPSYPYIIPLQ
jgi:hypothetical protein